MRFLSSYEVLVGFRYTKTKGGDRFVSFISLISMVGIALGVAALIVVLSVMNGFQHELRDRILGVVSHVQIKAAQGSLTDWKRLSKKIDSKDSVIGFAPYVTVQGLLSNKKFVRGVLIRGILPDFESQVSSINESLIYGSMDNLSEGSYKIIIGNELALRLNTGVGDQIMLMIPRGQVTPAGVLPRMRSFTVSGIFESGMYDYDSGLALVHLADSQRLTRSGEAISGLRLKLDDLFKAPWVRFELSSELGEQFYVTDWTQSHASFFRAVQIEKRVMFIILMLVVAVAAFNIVSTLVMSVSNKRADIAILRTLGASPKGIMAIFIIQGALIGFIGTVAGAFLGFLLASNIDVIVPFIESSFGMDLLSKDVYYISDLPSDIRIYDVFLVSAISFGLSIIATIYPSWRASVTRPTDALRYE